MKNRELRPILIEKRKLQPEKLFQNPDLEAFVKASSRAQAPWGLDLEASAIDHYLGR